MESGEVEVVARDLTAPSPFAAEALNARPYAFLDDAPLEERRTQAVMARRYADADSAGDLGRLDPAAIEAVREQAWPEARNADEMHDALMGLGCVTQHEAAGAMRLGRLAAQLLAQALQRRRAGCRTSASRRRRRDLWSVAAERLPQAQALYPDATAESRRSKPPPNSRKSHGPAKTRCVELLRSRLTGLGPTPAADLATALALPQSDIDMALLQLESEGYVMRGRFSPGAAQDEWCERHLLARIHRYTIGALRREIEPVEPRDFMRFLFDWQRVSKATRVSGPEALAGVLAQLEGFEAPAAAWESELLPARVSDYSISWLDDLCTAGRIAWTRLRGATADAGGTRATHRCAPRPIVLLPRRHLAAWTRLAPAASGEDDRRCPRAPSAWPITCSEHGASFFDELVGGAHLLRTELEDALAELVARGRVHCDSYAGLRALLVPQSKRPSAFGRAPAARRAVRHRGRGSLDADARPPAAATADAETANPDTVEHIARTLLRRYGVVCWRLLDREAPGCRRGGNCCASTIGSKRAAKSAAAVSSPACRANSSRLPEAISALRQVRKRAPRRRNGWRCRRWIRSTWSARCWPARRCRASSARACCGATAAARDLVRRRGRLAGRPARRRATRGAQDVAARTGVLAADGARHRPGERTPAKRVMVACAAGGAELWSVPFSRALMKTFFRSLVLLALLVASHAQAGERVRAEEPVRVFAAASLTNALNDIAARGNAPAIRCRALRSVRRPRSPNRSMRARRRMCSPRPI